MVAIPKAVAHSKSSKAHVLVLPYRYPSQGHINPMLQFEKRSASKGPKTTLVTTHFIISSIKAQSGQVQIKPISDGFDEVGFTGAVDLDVYLPRLEDIGSKTLSDLIEEESYSIRPFTCIVYDTYDPWGLDVAKRIGLTAITFSTQSCVVSAVYYYVNQGLVQVPRVGSSVSVAGSVPLAISDFPSFATDSGSYLTPSGLALEQFRLGKADWVLFNSFDELEGKWTDQPTNAKCVEDVWRVRVRARAREGFIDDFEIERCVQEVMEGERSGEMRENSRRWKAAVEAAVREGGSSNQGLEEFVEFLNGACGESDKLAN